MAVRCTAREDGDLLLARLDGPLDAHDVAGLHRSLLKLLAEQPRALIIDLAGLIVHDRLALTVFVALTRQAANWPGTPVLLCSPSAHTAGLLRRAAFRHLPVFAELSSARAAASRLQISMPTLREDLLPVTGAARRARDLATDACARWDLPHLIGPTSTVVDELVANAVTHAATAMTVRFSLTERFLHVTVRDGSPTEPRLDGGSTFAAASGRGLRLVEALASSWGSLPTPDGKVVWAALARTRG